MDITDVKIKLVPQSDEKLVAVACITFDGCFVVRDIKVIRGRNGMFIAMPSRKMTDRCQKCKAKNPVQAGYCSRCGTKLNDRKIKNNERGRAKLHVDIAHPINSACREQLQKAVVDAYFQEVEKSKNPDYVSPNLESDDAFSNSSKGASSPAPSNSAPSAENTKDNPADDGKGFGIFS